MRVFLIPEKVQYYMVQKNLNNLEMSEILNIKPATFSKYINKNSKISYEKALNIANALKIDINDIIQVDDIKKNISNDVNDDMLKNKLLDLWNKIDNETDKLILLVKISKFIESRKKE